MSSAVGAAALSQRRTTPGRRLPFLDPAALVWALLIAALVFLVASPMVRLVAASFQDPQTGAFTFANYFEAYGRWRHIEAIVNSIELGTGVALLAGAFGIPIAWAISRTDMPAKGVVRLLVFGAFIIPPYLGAIGWILLAGPNAGWLNKLWMGATGAQPGLFNVYSMSGLIVVVAVTSFPYVFVFTSSALDLVPSEMEDAANILGAGTLRTTLRVTLPLVLPAIIGGLIISFLEAIALFGAPALIALPARFHVVSTQLWQFFEYPVRVEEAAAYAMPLLAITVLMFALQRTLLGRRGYAAVSGKGGERRIVVGSMALGDARLCAPRFFVFGAAAHACPPASGVCKGMGPRLCARQSHAGEFPLSAVRADAGAASDPQHVRLRRAPRVCGLGPCACHCLCREPQARAMQQRARLALHGAVRNSRGRARNRLLCQLCTAAARPLWHRYHPGAWLYHPLSSHRVHCEAAGLRAINVEMEDAVRNLGGGRFVAIRTVWRRY